MSQGHRTRTRHGDKPIRFPLLGAFFRLTLATALSAYGLWFWFVGVQLYEPRGCTDNSFMFAKLDAAGGLSIFFKVQSVVVLIAYGALFVREFLMIICFLILTFAWTSVLAAITVGFGAEELVEANTQRKRRRLVAEGKMTPEEARKRQSKAALQLIAREFLSLFTPWIRLSFAITWKQVNGKESAGVNRPDLDFYLVPFIAFWIILVRTLFQFMCLVVFGWCPPVNMPPAVIRPSRILGPGWVRLKQYIKECYESKYTLYLIYFTNIACVVFTIISVELTLIWNNITDIYTVKSTGQLIPFIIGLVGFVRIIHELSVRRSAVSSTDVILELLDLEPPPESEDIDDVLSRSSITSQCTKEETFSLHDGNEAVFWERRPQRRHSIDIIRPEHVVQDERDQTDSKQDEHLEQRFDRGRLIDIYWDNGVEEYSTKDGFEITIVKDFRKRFPIPRRRRRRSYSMSISSSRSHTRSDGSGSFTGSSHSSFESGSRSRSRSGTSHRSRSADSEASRSSAARSSGSEVSTSQSRSHNSSNDRSVGSSSEPHSSTRSRSPQGNRRIAEAHHDGRPFDRKTRCAFYSVLLILCCIILPAYTLLKLIWKFGGARVRAALKELRHKLGAYYIRRFKEMTGRGATSEGTRKSEVRKTLPHCRPKKASNEVDLQPVYEAALSWSLLRWAPAVIVAAEQYLNSIHMPKSAAIAKSFGVLFEEAKEVRRQKREGKIGKTVQHELMAEKWHAHFEHGFLSTIQEEIESKPKRREWEQWKIYSNEDALKTWWTWSPGQDDVQRIPRPILA